MKFIEKENYKIVIDFAHTPDAIENICSGLANSFKNYSLVIVFGCGGNRDKTKRSLMGKAAEKWCQKIWLTSDNPRDEEPDQIIQDIYSGISNQMKVQCISDRSLAIFTALENLKSNEILIVAGKGHENYIESKGIKTPYSDEETVQRYFQSGNKND
jgi:UDP-N-acetylmuramoyl-L-alanyl-D-glutamate--2,6-diaminopimelate ligase